MADPEHIILAKSGPNAISRWREATWRRPNNQLPKFNLGYRLEDRSASEVFSPDYLYGRPSLDLSGGLLSAAKLPRADLAHDDLSGVDLIASDLREADLSGANLQGAHLSRSNLSRANFTGANMAGCGLGRTNLSNSSLKLADLKGADLSFANLTYADLEKADLSGTDLTQTNLSWANLNGANLRGARLIGANLDMADLTGADLRGATIIKTRLNSASLNNAICGVTTFANCDLTRTIGLELIQHSGPSMISLDTLSRSKGQVPTIFLEGAGVDPALIAAQDAIRSSRTTFTRVLLLGSESDGEFAAKVKASLAEARVPSWIIAADDEALLQSGEITLDSGVYYDRLVLLCTTESLESAHTSRYFGSLLNGSGFSLGDTLITVAADETFYKREDRLCSGLREGVVVDFRGWVDETRYKDAITTLVGEITGPVF
ncbi:MAG: pentapeptide repeat-containing protein [Chloroflexi bacterium]|nr:pentapeptide repeat-containing protein [Chloroflexota bacterium]